MSDELFDRWKTHRTQGEAPPDFVEGVLARLPVRSSQPVTWLRVAACLVAGLACLFRLAGVLGLFLPS